MRGLVSHAHASAQQISIQISTNCPLKQSSTLHTRVHRETAHPLRRDLQARSGSSVRRGHSGITGDSRTSATTLSSNKLQHTLPGRVLQVSCESYSGGSSYHISGEGCCVEALSFSCQMCVHGPRCTWFGLDFLFLHQSKSQ